MSDQPKPTDNGYDNGYEECRKLWKSEVQALRKVLGEIADERPVYDRAASAFYRVRQKAKEAIK